MKRNKILRQMAWALLLAASLSSLAAAQGMNAGPRGTTQPPPSILKNVGIEQHLDAQLPLDVKFRDETGREVKLGDYFGKKPVVLSMVYYECPMLCGEVLNGQASVFTTLKFDIGKEYDVVTVSFDPTEGPELARGKKKVYVERYGRPGGDEGWHFLTGSQESIKALTNAVGFNYAWDEQTKQFAHAAAILVVKPDGKIAQYFYGVEYSPKDLRFGIVQASQGKVGNDRRSSSSVLLPLRSAHGKIWRGGIPCIEDRGRIDRVNSRRVPHHHVPLGTAARPLGTRPRRKRLNVAEHSSMA